MSFTLCGIQLIDGGITNYPQTSQRKTAEFVLYIAHAYVKNLDMVQLGDSSASGGIHWGCCQLGYK